MLFLVDRMEREFSVLYVGVTLFWRSGRASRVLFFVVRGERV